jgi:hypothetical protein
MGLREAPQHGWGGRGERLEARRKLVWLNHKTW